MKTVESDCVQHQKLRKTCITKNHVHARFERNIPEFACVLSKCPDNMCTRVRVLIIYTTKFMWSFSLKLVTVNQFPIIFKCSSDRKPFETSEIHEINWTWHVIIYYFLYFNCVVFKVSLKGFCLTFWKLLKNYPPRNLCLFYFHLFSKHFMILALNWGHSKKQQHNLEKIDNKDLLKDIYI